MRKLILVLILLAPLPYAYAADEAPAQMLPRESLLDLLAAVAHRSGEIFLVDARVSPQVVIGQLRPNDVSYSLLLSILRNNDLAAVAVNGVINIVPVGVVRQFPLPVLQGKDVPIADEEWVTHIIALSNVPVATLVPILRPLMPQAGHLAANSESNTILIVDRYKNVQRLVSLITAMDEKRLN
jgi:general secretion pathway protein D